MRSRLLFAVIAVGIVAFACGPRSHSSETASVPPSMVRQENSPLATSLNVVVDLTLSKQVSVDSKGAPRMFPVSESRSIFVRPNVN